MTDVMTGGGTTPPSGTPTSGSPPVSPVGTGSGGTGNQVQVGGAVGGLTGFTTTVYTPPPMNSPIMDGTGSPSRTWLNWFLAIANLLANTYPPVIGEYRACAANNLFDSTWLLCNGASATTAAYPKLSAIMLPVLGAGSTSGTFLLPNIMGSTGLFWFVKAL